MYKLINENNNYESLFGEIAYGYYELKKSKFHTYIFVINDLKNIDDYINSIRKKHKKARHLLYAYELLNSNNIKTIKYVNDGEPQGSGINSTMNMLEKEGVTNYLVVTVRYFGGILLGAGPLARSYLNSFKEAFKECKKIEI